ncbi:hypothetical protein HDU97_006444 [Phlyctochytrium planicorne]|nr:hypothetical protein HDU97_006444 [Phlyctochytrium planicorne]
MLANNFANNISPIDPPLKPLNYQPTSTSEKRKSHPVPSRLNVSSSDPRHSLQDDRGLPTSSSEGSLSLFSNPGVVGYDVEEHAPEVAPRRSTGPQLDGPGGVGAWAEGVEKAILGDESAIGGVERMMAGLDIGLEGGLDDERIVQMLCDFESGFAMLLERIKSNMHSCKEVVQFLKKRAQIEEDYGKSMIKLSQSICNQKSDGKEGTFNTSWKEFVKVNEQVGEIRMRFSQNISEVAEELTTLYKNTERSRKQLKDAGYKHWKSVHDSEVSLEKSKTKYETLSEEWEKAILNKEMQASGSDASSPGSASPIAALRRGGLTKSLSNPMQLWKQGTSNPGKLQKMEDDARTRASNANEQYKQQLAATNMLRSSYFQSHLPRFIRMLKETNDQCDSGMKQHLARHAKEMEESLMKEATTLSPVDKDGPDMSIVSIIDRIDNARDFRQYMMEYFQNQKQLQKSEYQYSPYTMSAEAVSIANAKPVFGVSLSTVFERDGQAPMVVTRCIQAIEAYGLSYQGIYRISGTNTQIQRLRTLLDRDAEKVNMEEWSDNMPAVSGVLKLYFRELPDPLLPKQMYHALIDAAKIEDERMRLIAIHELVNNLNDAHYATLQLVIAHLWKVQKYEPDNRMNIQNLSIVWGPTLMDSPDSNPDPNELKHQSRVVETILYNFERIFELDD